MAKIPSIWINKVSGQEYFEKNRLGSHIILESKVDCGSGKVLFITQAVLENKFEKNQ